MTAAIVMGVIVLLGLAVGLHKSKAAETVQSLKPSQRMTFPVEPSNGDTYATDQAEWVYADGWRLK